MNLIENKMKRGDPKMTRVQEEQSVFQLYRESNLILEEGVF